TAPRTGQGVQGALRIPGLERVRGGLDGLDHGSAGGLEPPAGGDRARCTRQRRPVGLARRAEVTAYALGVTDPHVDLRLPRIAGARGNRGGAGVGRREQQGEEGSGHRFPLGDGADSRVASVAASACRWRVGDRVASAAASSAKANARAGRVLWTAPARWSNRSMAGSTWPDWSASRMAVRSAFSWGARRGPARAAADSNQRSAQRRS